MQQPNHLWRHFPCWWAVATIFFCADAGNAQCRWQQVQELVAADAGIGHGFGLILAASGDRLVVGEPRILDSGQGSAYVFEHDGANWVQTAKLQATDGKERDQFGFAVAVDGDWIVVGAPFADSSTHANAGAAYLCHWNGVSWNEHEKVETSAADARFGFSVALDGDVLAVGGPGWGRSGSVRISRFDGTHWVTEARLDSPSAVEDAAFGAAASLHGSLLLVGATSDDGLTQRTGSASVFRHDGSNWQLEGTVTAPDGATGELFGHAVAVEGDRALVGAPGASAVYFFDFDGAAWRTRRTHRRRAVNLGAAVELHGDRAVAGATTWSADGVRHSGAALLFVREGVDWRKDELLFDAERAPADHAGTGVAFTGDRLLIASWLHDSKGTNSGAVHAWQAHDLILTLEPREARAGDTIEAGLCRGRALAPFLLFLDSAPLAVLRFDSAGEFRGTATVPPGLEGSRFEFFAIGTLHDGNFGLSNAVFLEIE